MIVGIDPGKLGGITKMTPEGEIVECKAFDVGGFSYKGYVEILEDVIDEDDVVWIEDVHSLYGMGAKSNFSFGGIVIGTHMHLIWREIDYNLVQPKKWQSEVWEAEDLVYVERKRKKKKDTKATSLNAASRIWPDQNWVKSKRAYKPHDGMYDSALIAYYGTKQNIE